jgi:hypothetical protein
LSPSLYSFQHTESFIITIIMPGLPWLLFKGAFKMTAKGAAVTLSSTVASCTLACYIEIGAHRMVYHYFPYRYANVEYANGLTQEQLDAVRTYNVLATSATSPEHTSTEEQENDASFLAASASDEKLTVTSEDISTAYKPPTDKELAEIRPISNNESATTTNSFWKEEKEREGEGETLPNASSFLFPSNDILACAMTG